MLMWQALSTLLQLIARCHAMHQDTTACKVGGNAQRKVLCRQQLQVRDSHILTGFVCAWNALSLFFNVSALSSLRWTRGSPVTSSLPGTLGGANFS